LRYFRVRRSDSNKASEKAKDKLADARESRACVQSQLMAKPDAYRVQYGSQGSQATSLWPWVIAVTLLVGGWSYYYFWFIPLQQQLPATGAPPIAPGAPTQATGTPAKTPDTTGGQLPLAIPDVAGEAELMRYFPLGDGHAWQYSEEQTHLGESAKAGPNVMFKVVSIDRTGDSPIYRCSLNNVELFYYLSGNDLIASRTSGGAGLIQLRAPLTDGATWEAPEGVTQWRIRRLNATVEVPAGEFECLELEKEPISGEGAQETLFYAPGIGMVQQITQHGMGERTTWSLIGYVIEGTSYGSMEKKSTEVETPSE